MNPAKIAIESLAIFVSVFLAFAAENYREEQNEREQANAILTLVQVELEANLAELEAVIPQREAQVNGYIAALGELQESNSFPSVLPPFSRPEITRIAYELATDTGAVSKVSPEKLLIVARAYTALEAVGSNDDFFDRRTAQIRFNDGEQYLSGFIYYLNRAARNEPVAASHVREAIEVLKAR